jgi:hypothetical protein
MWRGIIIHYDELIADSACVGSEGRHLGTADPSWFPVAGQGDRFVQPYWFRPRPSVILRLMMDNAGILVPLSWLAPHSSTTISVAQTKSELSVNSTGVQSATTQFTWFGPGQSSSTVWLCFFVLSFFAILNNFSIIYMMAVSFYWWKRYILYNAFGKRPLTFCKKTDKLSHTVTSVRAGFEPTRAGGERSSGMRPMS